MPPGRDYRFGLTLPGMNIFPSPATTRFTGRPQDSEATLWLFAEEKHLSIRPNSSSPLSFLSLPDHGLKVFLQMLSLERISVRASR